MTHRIALVNNIDLIFLYIKLIYANLYKSLIKQCNIVIGFTLYLLIMIHFTLKVILITYFKSLNYLGKEIIITFLFPPFFSLS